MYLPYLHSMTAANRRMFWLLARAQRRVAAASDDSLADLGLTGTQAGALFCFREEGLLIGELGQALDLAQSAASGLAKRLEEAGLIVRADEKGDGRAARLRLSAMGKRKRDEAARRAVAANARMLQGFSEREIDAVVRWLNHVADMAAPSKQKEKT
jgi:DNA-binding MarR family transcriptional regulator